MSLRFDRSKQISSRFVVLFFWCLWNGSLPEKAWSQERPIAKVQVVQVAESDQVEILFDRKIAASQIRTEYLNDIVQLSVSDASVYPAKIFSVSGKELKKIFVYQYAPQLVRVRLTVLGRAENFQGKLALEAVGRRLTVRLGGKTAPQKNLTAEVKRELGSPSSVTPSRIADSPQVQSMVERSRVHDETVVKPEVSQLTFSKRRDDQKAHMLTGGKETSSPVRMFSSLMGVVLLFWIVARFLKKFTASRTNSSAVGKWVRRSLGGADRVIEVIATHHLGPNKSIHMVRVADRTLVLGVSNDSINLITELKESEVSDGIRLDDSTSSQDKNFLNSLGEQLVKEMPPPGTFSTSMPSEEPAVDLIKKPEADSNDSHVTNLRARIRNRLEGVKQI